MPRSAATPIRTLLAILAGTAAVATFSTGVARGQSEPPVLRGVYQAIADSAVLPGGLRNVGAPRDIRVLPAVAEHAKAVNLKDDPFKLCLPVGPFRMMAANGAKIELVPTATTIVMLFEDLSHGYVRTFYLKRPHRPDAPLMWQGDSVAHWEASTLVVDTVGLSDQVWLNENGVQHSDALHLVERITPILRGNYLEYKMTAGDPKVLAAPYTYTRYYQKLDSEILEDSCEIQD